MLSSKNIVIPLIIVSLIFSVASLLGRESDTPIVSPSPLITESRDIVAIQSPEVSSPDGKMKLVMEKITDGDNATYSFSVLEKTEDSKKAIFSKTVLAGTKMEISPNAWSPDNKYFFIKEAGNGSTNYFVFRADSESFGESEQYIEVVERFVAKNTGYTLSEITGWDSNTLLHVYTTKEDESRGPSFWFEIPSRAIIRLASR